MKFATMFNQNPIAKERIVHFHKCNAINVRDFQDPQAERDRPGKIVRQPKSPKSTLLAPPLPDPL